MSRRRIRLLIRLLVLATLILPLDVLPARFTPVAYAAPTVFTVTNTNDSGPGSLRQAIIDANVHPNASTSDADVDVITFTIPAAQCSPVTHACTISPLSALPTITDGVTLDGWSQGGPGFSGLPLIELNGASAGDGVSGLTLGGLNVSSPFLGTVQGFVINSFGGNGITVVGAKAQVFGNYIGIDASGGIKKPNRFTGISLDNATSSKIGGDDVKANVISGNNVGILIHGPFSFIQVLGNVIGMDAFKLVPLGNSSDGIFLDDASAVFIGDMISGPGAPRLIPNVIAYNGRNGISTRLGASYRIRGNNIFQNAGLGIDIGSDGVTPRRPRSTDLDPNGIQDIPTILSARPTAGGTLIAGRDGAGGGPTYDIDLYASPSCDASGYGEGASYLGSTPTDADGTFQLVVPALSLGRVVTGTATAPLTALFGSTSEFSACRAVAQPSITVTPANPLVTTEAGGTTTATVVLTEQPTANVTIPLSSSNTHEGTVSPATLTFTPTTWAVPQTITITGVDDAVADGDLAYQIAIGQATSTDAGYNGLNPNDLLVVNRDDEGTPAFSIADVRIAEGNTGTTTASFAVTLAPPSSGIVSVRYATSDGSATAPSDYTATSGTLTFEPGETSKTISVPVVGDTSVEPDETFAATLSSPVHATIARGQARGTITNDDASAPTPCSPRPNPRVQTTSIGAGRLQVVVAAQTTAALPSNVLQRLDFGAAENARVEIPGAAPGSPGGPSSTPGGPAGTPGSFSLPLPPGTMSATFVVQRQQPGPFRVAYTIVDNCQSAGAFTTFVGGGTGVQ